MAKINNIMQVLVVEKMNLLSEFYFAILLDRAFMVHVTLLTLETCNY